MIQITGETAQQVQQVSEKSLKLKDIICRRNAPTGECIGFQVQTVVNVDGTDEHAIVQNFYYERLGEKDWQVSCMIGDGSDELDVMPIIIKYSIPVKDFDLVKVAQMGLIYIKGVMDIRREYFEVVNYNILELISGF